MPCKTKIFVTDFPIFVPTQSTWYNRRRKSRRGPLSIRNHTSERLEGACATCPPQVWYNSRRQTESARSGPRIGTVQSVSPPARTVWTGSRVSLRQQRGISEGEKKGNQKIPGTARTARPGAGTGGSGTLCSVHGGGRSAILRPSGVGSGICDPIHLLKMVSIRNCPEHQDALCRNSSGESINHKAACALCYPQGVFSTSPGKEGGILWKEI